MMKQSLLLKLLANQRSSNDLQELLEGLLTPKELSEIDQRIKIVAMLKADVPQREISQKLQVGLATITRGSAELKRGHFQQIKPNKNAWRPQSEP